MRPPHFAKNFLFAVWGESEALTGHEAVQAVFMAFAASNYFLAVINSITMNASNEFNPWKGQLRALERNIAKYRAMEMVLVIHYAEEMRRIIFEPVNRKPFSAGFPEQDTKVATKQKPVRDPKKAMKFWLESGLLNQGEADEIAAIVDYRNHIAHRVHELSADLSDERFVRSHVAFDEKRASYDYEAVSRIRKMIDLLQERIRQHGLITTLNLNWFYFQTTERALNAELKALRKKINKLYKARLAQGRALEKECADLVKNLQGEDYPAHPLHHYDNDRLTRRGEEVCYRLFDKGASVPAVALLMRLSIASARHRKKLWEGAGGSKRVQVDLQDIPKRKFYARYED